MHAQNKPPTIQYKLNIPDDVNARLDFSVCYEVMKSVTDMNKKKLGDDERQPISYFLLYKIIQEIQNPK